MQGRRRSRQGDGPAVGCCGRCCNSAAVLALLGRRGGRNGAAAHVRLVQVHHQLVQVLEATRAPNPPTVERHPAASPRRIGGHRGKKIINRTFAAAAEPAVGRACFVRLRFQQCSVLGNLLR